MTPHHQATLLGDVTVIKTLLEYDRIYVTMRDSENGQTVLLHLASALGDLETIDALLSHEDSNSQALNNHGHLPVKLAALEFHKGAVRRLASKICRRLFGR